MLACNLLFISFSLLYFNSNSLLSRRHDLSTHTRCLNLNATEGVICHRSFVARFFFFFFFHLFNNRFCYNDVWVYAFDSLRACVSIVSTIIPFFFFAFSRFSVSRCQLFSFQLTHHIWLTMQKSGLKVLLLAQGFFLFYLKAMRWQYIVLSFHSHFFYLYYINQQIKYLKDNRQRTKIIVPIIILLTF